jgi:hypothetical protein
MNSRYLEVNNVIFLSSVEAEKYNAGSEDRTKHYFPDIAQVAFWAA